MPLPRRHTPRQPNPHPFPALPAPPRPIPSCTATSSQSPAPIHLPFSPPDLYPSPALHTPLLVAGGHAPALAPPSLRLCLVRLVFRGAQLLGGTARSSLAPPLLKRGRGALLLPSERWDPPPSRACLVLPGRRGLDPVKPHSSVACLGKKGGGYRGIPRNLLIREPRLPFNPTGRHCLSGRSIRKGEKDYLAQKGWCGAWNS